MRTLWAGTLCALVLTNYSAAEWFRYKLDASADFPNPIDIAVGPTDQPHAIWGVERVGDGWTPLKYARWTGEEWIGCDLPVAGTVPFAGLAVASDDTPRVVWADLGAVDQYRCAIGDGECTWPTVCSIYPTGARLGGQVPSIDLDGQDRAQIAFFYGDGEDLGYVREDARGSCTFALEWAAQSGPIGKGADIAVDSRGDAHIVCLLQDGQIVYVTNTSGNWSEREPVVPTTSGASHIRLDSNDTPHVLVKTADGCSQFIYARRVSGQWIRVTLPVAGRGHADLVLDSANWMHTFVLECASNTLRHLSTGNGGQNWHIETLPCQFDGLIPASLAIDSAGTLYVLAIGPEGAVYIVSTVNVRPPGTQPPCGGLDPCDTNCDGSVNPFDIQPFIDILNCPRGACSPCAADTNADGTLNGFDIQGFVDCLGG